MVYDQPQEQDSTLQYLHSHNPGANTRRVMWLQSPSMLWYLQLATGDLYVLDTPLGTHVNS